MKRYRLLLIPVLALVFAFTINTVEQKITQEPTAPVEVSADYDSSYVRGDLKDGVYEAQADGFNDIIAIRMTVEYGRISKFEVIENNETEAVAKNALIGIPFSIVENQSVNIDVVSSATETSEGILKAARDCIRQAGGNPNDY